jgi:hypothetical protein
VTATATTLETITALYSGMTMMNEPPPLLHLK